MPTTSEIILLIIGILNLFVMLAILLVYNKSYKEYRSIENNLSKYYAVCVCTKQKGQKVYKSFITEDRHADLSSVDLETLRQNVLRANPEFVDCVIVFFQQVKD